MSRVTYNALSDAELKQYFLKRRGDRAAFQAYLDRLNQRPLRIIASPGDPDFDQKVQVALRAYPKTRIARTAMQAEAR